MGKNVVIDQLSTVPLFLECYAAGSVLGSGTGFIVKRANTAFLITNWHVLSGRNPSTGKPLTTTGALPDVVAIWHHIRGKLGTWGRRFEALTNPDGSNKWLEHPDGRTIDVVALPITTDDELQLYDLDLKLAATDLILFPSEPVSIIGFPYGLSSGGRFPIWKTGHIASDIDLPYESLPAFVIDATTKPGMSGSPVVARRIGMYQTSQAIQMGGQATRFLGVYSGRIHEQADVGIVWRPEVISSILHS